MSAIWATEEQSENSDIFESSMQSRFPFIDNLLCVSAGNFKGRGSEFSDIISLVKITTPTNEQERSHDRRERK